LVQNCKKISFSFSCKTATHFVLVFSAKQFYLHHIRYKNFTVIRKNDGLYASFLKFCSCQKLIQLLFFFLEIMDNIVKGVWLNEESYHLCNEAIIRMNGILKQQKLHNDWDIKRETIQNQFDQGLIPENKFELFMKSLREPFVTVNIREYIHLFFF
jgi:hypothetical protein